MEVKKTHRDRDRDIKERERDRITAEKRILFFIFRVWIMAMVLVERCIESSESRIVLVD